MAPTGVNYATRHMRCTGTYTEPPGTYTGVTTTTSDTKPFEFDFWILDGTAQQVIDRVTARANDKTKDMRLQGQVFSSYTIANHPTTPTRPNQPPTP